MLSEKQLQKLAFQHGTPIFIVDHDEIRRNYAEFKKHLPRVQAYYAVKAEPLPEIVKTLFDAGASFDVASMPEFDIVYENIKGMPDKRRQDWIWDKIIYANPIKPNETLRELDAYKPLVTYDNAEEIRKIKKYAPNAGLALRIRVPNTGAMVELSSKFGAASGEAVDLILEAVKSGLVVEGLSFHVGSQTTNFENFVQAINLAADIFREAGDRGYKKMNLLDIGGGFPAPYDESVKPFKILAQRINAELDRLFPKEVEILAEPGRFMIATAATSIVKINGKAVRDGKVCYYVNDGVYHTYSGIIFDHCHYHLKSFRKGPERICGVFGPTCDALDVISMSENLPSDLDLGELLYSPNIGAYSHASSTSFNGFPPAKVVHVNYKTSPTKKETLVRSY
ncbi:MAG: type III PLP-dependent enzyme [Elusimicrobia bacterium CG08_land_8_20_14_0_20_51_18]|nr:MAG: type III PLP-dependent enzyme [Elusimicrobia bacterium CG08_land_8_20_14_0_20_51_18]